MLEQSNKWFKPAEEGENVNVPIPDVDRGRLDPPNITAVLQEHDSETGLYTLGTKAGTLNTRFSRNQFNLMNQKFLNSWRQLTFLKTSHSVWEKLLVSTATRVDKDFWSASAKLLGWQRNANASGTLSSAILAVIKIVFARIMTTPWTNKVIKRNPFPFNRVSSFLVSGCWGSNRLVPPFIPHHQHRNLHIYHQHEQHDGIQWWAPARGSQNGWLIIVK